MIANKKRKKVFSGRKLPLNRGFGFQDEDPSPAEFNPGIKTGRYYDSKAEFQAFCYMIVKGDL